MIAIQWIAIVLSVVYVDATTTDPSMLQATTAGCPAPDIAFCDYVQCENGRCVDDKTNPECFKCLCDVGFTGKLCETSIAISTACNPGCQNGGNCEQTAANTYVCVCPPDYTGAQCQTSLFTTHPCVTMPGTVCQNGGTCTINGAGYLCSCAAGWNGTNCQIQETITQCTPNLCGAHGTCLQATSPNGPVVLCNCENRWTGKFCDVNIDVTCPAGYCQSGGTCRTDGNVLSCQCPPTHVGPRCETYIGGVSTVTATSTSMTMTTPLFTTTTSRSTLSPVPGSCASNPCLNGGSCYNTGNYFVCLCNAQWSGSTCNAPNLMTTPVPTTAGISACSSNPCSNGGTCYRHNSGFICVCTSQFAGPTCGLPKTTTTSAMITGTPSITCANRPCQNGATCYNSGTSYFCYCGPNSNYTGKNCEMPTTVLSADCPLNCSPGTCVRSGGSQSAYACMCNGTLMPTSCPTN